MTLTRELATLKDEQLPERLSQAEVGSYAWFGVTGEILRRRLAAVHLTMERSANQTEKLTQQIDRLLEIAEIQKLFAEKLERQTTTLINMTHTLSSGSRSS